MSVSSQVCLFSVNTTKSLQNQRFKQQQFVPFVPCVTEYDPGLLATPATAKVSAVTLYSKGSMRPLCVLPLQAPVIICWKSCFPTTIWKSFPLLKTTLILPPSSSLSVFKSIVRVALSCLQLGMVLVLRVMWSHGTTLVIQDNDPLQFTMNNLNHDRRVLFAKSNNSLSGFDCRHFYGEKKYCLNSNPFQCYWFKNYTELGPTREMEDY